MEKNCIVVVKEESGEKLIIRKEYYDMLIENGANIAAELLCDETIISERDGLISLSIPSGINGIGPFAFCDWNNLKDILIPESVKFIALGAFQNCSNLKIIHFMGTKDKWDKIDKAEADIPSPIKILFENE